MKYRIIAALLALSCTALAFSACGKDKDTVDPDPVEELTTLADLTAVLPASSAPETTAAPTTAADTTVTTTAPTTQATTAAPTTQATTAAPTTQAPTAAPTTQAPAPAPATSKSASQLAASIAGHSNLFEEQMTESSSSRALSLFGIDSSLVADASYYAASAAVAEEILVVRAADSSAVSAIVNGMNSRKTTQIDDYSDYVPKEVPKLQNAVTYTSGDYVVFCVSQDGSAAASIIRDLF